jgi:hypothetical protein
LEKAQQYDLYFKAKKFKFRKPKIKYLGLVVEEGKLAMDPTKLKEIGLHQKQLKKYDPSLDLETFTIAFSKKSPIWHILFIIYWKRTRNLSGQMNAKNLLINPKNNSLKNKSLWCQTIQNLFRYKSTLCYLPLEVSLLKWTPMEIDILAPIFSKVWQRNKETTTLETENYWQIIQALKEWRHYIQGSGHTTTVLSDYDNLWHFKVPQTIGWQMAQ